MSVGSHRTPEAPAPGARPCLPCPPPQVDAVYERIYSGEGSMPGFGVNCAPKLQCTFGPRLSDEEIRGLAVYVLDRAAANWAAAE